MKNNETSSSPLGHSRLAVFYDGHCPLCSREVAHYSARDSKGVLHVIDIADPDFDPTAEGVDPARVHDRFHVRCSDGQLVNGVDAFAAIWEALDIWPLAVACSRNPILRIPLDIGYHCFAKIRPLFRRRGCHGSCPITKTSRSKRNAES